MTDHSVKRLLVLTVLVVAVLPLLAALYFLDHALQTSLDLGFNRHIVRVLDASSHNLKELKELNPQRASEYRHQFEEIEELRHVYANPELLKGSVRDSLRIYFAVGVLTVVLLSVLVAVVLGRRIARAYQLTFDELTRQREKVQYLQQMSSWQELARMLAHEIKNPLTPIELLVSSLAKSHRQKSAEQFQQQLDQTVGMVGEELAHLKSTVSRFSDFARIPAAHLATEDLAATVGQQLQAIGAACEVDIDLLTDAVPVALRVRIDATLLRQALTNIVQNGVEANPDRRVKFTVQVSATDRIATIAISNDGAPVPAQIAASMFEPYISGHNSKDNMGLGLAIVKKIVLEHGGEIGYATREGRPTFSISLPRPSSSRIGS